MSTGMKEILQNPSERALSDDINRLQRFKAFDIAETWRAILDTYQGTDDFDAASNDVQTFTQNSPVSGMILSGLRVVPQIGAGVLSILVDPGVGFLYDPDVPANPDESQYKFVNDPGISTPGTLLMTANGAGSTRIDVVECARVPAPGFSVLEVDNRDIFDQVSGLFTAQSVNKVLAGRLQFRVRAGVAGAGFPGTSPGWMPLAVASVPAGANTCDAVTFWDVRPLAADRIFAPFNISIDIPKLTPNYLTIDTSIGGQARLQGTFEVTLGTNSALAGALRRLGGESNRGTPGLDGFVNLNDAANQCDALSGFHTHAYVYVLEPFGLPRWARYTDPSSGSRVPRSPRGIIAISMTTPHADGSPSAALALPTSTGLGGNTQAAACIAATVLEAGAVQGLGSDGFRQWSTDTTSLAYEFGTVVPAGNLATFQFTPGFTSGGAGSATVGYPPHARSLDLVIQLRITAPASTCATISPQVLAYNPGGGVEFKQTLGAVTLTASAAAPALFTSFRLRIPTPADSSNFTTSSGFRVDVQTTLPGGTTFDQCVVSVIGWGL